MTRSLCTRMLTLSLLACLFTAPLFAADTPISAVLTGKVHGPELDKVFAVLGKDTALKRLKPFTGYTK